MAGSFSMVANLPVRSPTCTTALRSVDASVKWSVDHAGTCSWTSRNVDTFLQVFFRKRSLTSRQRSRNI